MKTLIFDFDGVLMDSMPYWGGSMVQFLQNNAVPYPADIIRQITPLGNSGAVTYFREKLGLEKDPATALAEIQAILYPNYRDIVPLKEGVADFLRAAKAAGCSLNVLTASPHVNVDPCLQRNGIFDLFDNIWSCEDFGTTKSDPGIYVAAAARLGVDVEDCVFFDDNIIAARTALEAGMPTIGVYDASGEDFIHEMQTTLPRYIRSFTELQAEDFK